MFRTISILPASGLAAALGMALLFSMTPPATAGPCGARQDIANLLEQRFGETIQATGITGPGALLELYVSQKGTWTMVLTLPNGPSCTVADGIDWESKVAAIPPEG